MDGIGKRQLLNACFFLLHNLTRKRTLNWHAAGLATSSDVVGVTLGGVLGHALCTGAAVLGGKHLAERVDERVVSGIGGVLFLLFGAHALWSGPPKT